MNLKGYDQCKVIPVNKESVLGIRISETSAKERRPRISIMDSNLFLMGPQDKLAQRLFKDGHDMSLLKASRICLDKNGDFSPEKYKLMTRKGIVNVI